MRILLLALLLSLAGCEFSEYQCPENREIILRSACIDAGFPGTYKVVYVRRGHHALCCFREDGTCQHVE